MQENQNQNFICIKSKKLFVDNLIKLKVKSKYIGKDLYAIGFFASGKIGTPEKYKF